MLHSETDLIVSSSLLMPATQQPQMKFKVVGAILGQVTNHKIVLLVQ